MSPLAVALLRERGRSPEEAAALARLIKSAPLKVVGVGGLERAISTAGGIIWDAWTSN